MTVLVINFRSNHDMISYNEATIFDFFDYHVYVHFLSIKDIIVEAWVNRVFTGREVMDSENFSVVWKMTFIDEQQKQNFINLITPYLNTTDVNFSSCKVTIEDESYYDNVASTIQDKEIELLFYPFIDQ